MLLAIYWKRIKTSFYNMKVETKSPRTVSYFKDGDT